MILRANLHLSDATSSRLRRHYPYEYGGGHDQEECESDPYQVFVNEFLWNAGHQPMTDCGLQWFRSLDNTSEKDYERSKQRCMITSMRKLRSATMMARTANRIQSPPHSRTRNTFWVRFPAKPDFRVLFLIFFLRCSRNWFDFCDWVTAKLDNFSRYWPNINDCS